MAFQSWITINTLKYKTLREWKPSLVKPGTMRLNIGGALDVTYGPAVVKEWKGRIKVDNVPDSGYGTPAQLRTALDALASITFIDHWNASHTAHVFGYDETSVLPDWDSNENSFYFDVVIRGQ